MHTHGVQLIPRKENLKIALFLLQALQMMMRSTRLHLNAETWKFLFYWHKDVAWSSAGILKYEERHRLGLG